MKNKHFISVLSAVLLLLSTTSTAYAADHTVPVDLTVETPIFSVTVPTSLPITLTESGDVQVADNACIINGSAGPVKITAIDITGINGWQTVDYTAYDTASAKVDSKSVGLTMTLSDTTLHTTGADINDFVGPVVLTKGETLPLNYNAKVPAQKEAKTSTQVAEVVFTVGWDD